MYTGRHGRRSRTSSHEKISVISLRYGDGDGVSKGFFRFLLDLSMMCEYDVPATDRVRASRSLLSTGLRTFIPTDSIRPEYPTHRFLCCFFQFKPYCYHLAPPDLPLTDR